MRKTCFREGSDSYAGKRKAQRTNEVRSSTAPEAFGDELNGRKYMLH
jgi:type IV secretory pathway VirD2 relaxase